VYCRDLFAEVIPLSLLLTIGPRDAIAAVLGGVADHAVERDCDPGSGLGDERGGRIKVRL
jgi:hypothetical protein